MTSGLLSFSLFNSRGEGKDLFFFSLSLLRLISPGKKWCRAHWLPYYGFKYPGYEVFNSDCATHGLGGNQELNMVSLALWYVLPECTIDFTLGCLISSSAFCAWTDFYSDSFLWPAPDTVSSAWFNIPCGFCATFLTFYDILLWKSFF